MTMTPRRRSILALLCLGIALPSASRAQNPPTEDAAQRWARFEPEFQAFAAADRAKATAPGGILFVGSSIFRQWANVAEMMAPLPVLNRAFGGSRTGDLLARFDQLVPPYAPKVIVYYCGSNDLKAFEVTEDPAQIFARFRTFSERVRAARPSTRIIFVSSTRSPDRVARWSQVDHYNALVRAYSAATPGHTFIDINPALVDADGRPRLELYKDDKLHFHPPAYVLFAQIIKPVLERVWREVEGNATAPIDAAGENEPRSRRLKAS
jgi:lysophospholipase L1-like esterase